jgi:hypothetical protein
MIPKSREAEPNQAGSGKRNQGADSMLYPFCRILAPVILERVADIVDAAEAREHEELALFGQKRLVLLEVELTIHDAPRIHTRILPDDIF